MISQVTWQINPQDYQKYEQQFLTLYPVDGLVNGATAGGFLKQSGLPVPILAQIWDLSDINQDGQMNSHEFCVAMFLTQKCLAGVALPPKLPESLKLPPPKSGFTTTIPPPLLSQSSLASLANFPLNLSSSMSSTSASGPGLKRDSFHDSVIYSSTNSRSSTMSVGDPLARPASVTPLATYEQWTLSHHLTPRTRLEFNNHDHHRRGYLTGPEARSIFLQSGLPQPVLAQIWFLADMDGDGNMTFEEYCIAQFLIEQAKKGIPMPPTLPANLRASVVKQAPPAAPATSHSVFPTISYSPTLTSKEQAAIHGDAESVKVAENDETSGAFANREEERRANFRRGQEELARRQAVLREQMEREEEVRREKEKQESEKLEKIRLEKERARQIELEHKLEQQRKLELERAEEAQRLTEERENQRREMEKQRLLQMEARRLDAVLQEKCFEQDLKEKIRLRHSEKSEELSRIQHQFESLQSELESHRQAVMELRDMISTQMRQEHDQLERSLRDLDVQAEAARAESARLQKEVDRARLEAQRSQQGTTNVEQVRSLEASVSGKKVAVKISADSLIAMEKELMEGGESLAMQRNKLADLEKKCKKMSSEVSQFRQQLSKQLRCYSDKKATQVQPVPEAFFEASWPTATAPQGDQFAAFPSTVDPVPLPVTDPFAAVKPTNVKNDLNGSFATPFSPQMIKDPFADHDVSLWADTSTAATTNHDAKNSTGRRFKANFEFTARQSDELSFVKDDIIVVDADHFVEGEDWLIGQLESDPTRQGLFPLTYCSPMSQSAPEVAPAPAVTTTEFSPNAPLADDPFAAFGDTSLFPPSITMGATTTTDSPWGNMTHDAPAYGVDASAIFPAFEANFDMVDRAVNSGTATPAPPAHEEPESLNDCGMCLALYTFEGQESGDLEFTQGQYIHIVSDSGEWWKGYRHGDDTRTLGIFPANFVRRLTAAEKDEVLSPKPAVERSSSMNGGPKVCANLLAHASTAVASPEVMEVVIPYTANGAEQLSLSVGQQVVVRKKSDTGWWEGEVQVGAARRIGWFPRDYVKPATPDAAERATNGKAPQNKAFTLIRADPMRPKSSLGYNFPPITPATSTSTTQSAQPKKAVPPQRPATGPPLKSKNKSTTAGKKEQVVTLFAFKAMRSDELSFEKGEIITVLNRDEPEWWRGRLDSSGAQGLFPVNYVKSLQTNNSQESTKRPT